MKSYQYKTFSQKITGMTSRTVNTQEVDNQMNALGQEGWVLVRTENILSNGWSDYILFIFQKPNAISTLSWYYYKTKSYWRENLKNITAPNR